MGRLLALILGGIGIVLYGPDLIPGEAGLEVRNVVSGLLGDEWYQRVKDSGAGILAGLALILFAVRGRE